MAAMKLALLMIFAIRLQAIILRLPCASYADFSIVLEDKVLSESSIKTIHFITLNECKHQCVMHVLCKAISFKKGEVTECRLHNQTTESIKDNVNLKSAIAWVFLTTNHSKALVCML